MSRCAKLGKGARFAEGRKGCATLRRLCLGRWEGGAGATGFFPAFLSYNDEVGGKMTTLQKTKDHGGVRGYLKQSREPLTAAIAVLPLFVAYQVGILVAGGARNGVDFVSDLLRWAFGGDLGTYLIFNAVVLVGFVGAVVVLRRKGELHPRVLPLMLLECSVYAVLVGGLVNTLIHLTGLSGLLAAGGSAPGLLTKIVLSAGAGLYEELVFRLMMMGGLFWVLHKVGGLGRVAASLLAVVASSLIFSAVHHIVEPFTLSAFIFRFFAGVIFAILFYGRGFAIAVWTHALYDVWVMVFHDPG